MKRFAALLILAIAAPVSAQDDLYGLGPTTPTRIEVGQITDTFGLSGDAIASKPITAPVQRTVAKPEAATRPTPKAKATAAKPYSSPPGFHRHQYPDGRVFEHEDWNLGDPIAHAGLPSPWPKYNGPLAPNAPAPTGSLIQTTNHSTCPPGGCPTNSVRRPILRRFAR